MMKAFSPTDGFDSTQTPPPSVTLMEQCNWLMDAVKALKMDKIHSVELCIEDGFLMGIQQKVKVSYDNYYKPFITLTYSNILLLEHLCDLNFL